jgi:hypothetical protein
MTPVVAALKNLWNSPDIKKDIEKYNKYHITTTQLKKY